MNKEKGEGYTAFLYGIKNCPYDEATDKNLSWWYGWYSAREEDSQKP